MLTESLHIAMGVAGTLSAIYTLPGTWALARWTWAARHRPAEQLGPESNAPILILMPAHNEAATLPRTLPAVLEQARQDGRTQLVVIADNCTDDTAEIALQLGAMSISRRDEQLRGKGYALSHALSVFPHFPWYLIVDADSTLDAQFLAKLRQSMAAQPDAIQARYEPLCEADDRLAELKQWALHAFNVDRQRGRAQLNESVSMLGNGFAVSAQTLQQVPYRAGSIVEDFEYQLSLQAAGLRIHWLEEVAVYGEMPTGNGEATQRARWEGGRIAMLRQYGGPLIRQLLQGNMRAWPALQELLLLPLSWHTALLGLALLGGGLATLIACIGLLVLAAHAALALAELPANQRRGALRGLPHYLLWKLAQLPRILRSSGKNSPWLRSERQAERRNA